MQLRDLDFSLPDALIAQEPVSPRDSARLFVYRVGTNTIEHHHVFDLPRLLPAKTLLVANNSKVRKSRLRAQDAKGRAVEILLLEEIRSHRYRCLLGGLRGAKPGDSLTLNPEITARILERESHPTITTYIVDFESPAPFDLEDFAEVPLPPYIKHSQSHPEHYQTTYASQLGSSAAPTAGLHFTPALIADITAHDMTWAEVTLHVGLGTFAPLRNQDITQNTLHFEQTSISPAVAKTITQAKQDGLPIMAIGTTSCRTLESHAKQSQIIPGDLRTNLFIYPGYHFEVVDILFTNFHLPHSSLLLLVAAFLGHSAQLPPEQALALLKKLYAEAIRNEYRFYSFGDAMLILK